MTPFKQHNALIDKENAYLLLKEFAKEYKKQHGKQPLEITIVGGGSVLLNYGFRNNTVDFDIITTSNASIKDAVINIADKFGLPTDWMNDDFKYSKSYSPRIEEISQYYCSFNNQTLIVRTVNAEYLIAIKMQSGREFGNDISDIIGIIKTEKGNGNVIDYQSIISAGEFLYGNCFEVSESLSARVEKYCNMSLDELDFEYILSIEKAEIIFDTILEKDNIKDREQIKALGIELENQLFQTPEGRKKLDIIRKMYAIPTKATDNNKENRIEDIIKKNNKHTVKSQVIKTRTEH